ncbi:hypothetical protein CCAX7_54150 [Capsulimonas corticalis]|uniref:Uncharacterized protein n=1 Tax=Capsulimonas corticalis TaxID=2219043 RepID=A0A402CNP6_9BACT|nr:hypothetical protein CCAX7_54150 [Capsulimonas corticalis]
MQLAKVSLVEITPRAFAVEEADFEAFQKTRPKSGGKGRPPGVSNKLPDGVNKETLEGLGYKMLPDGRMKLVRAQSFRSHCQFCGLWYKQLLMGRCKKCTITHPYP